MDFPVDLSKKELNPTYKIYDKPLDIIYSDQYDLTLREKWEILKYYAQEIQNMPLVKKDAFLGFLWDLCGTFYPITYTPKNRRNKPILHPDSEIWFTLPNQFLDTNGFIQFDSVICNILDSFKIEYHKSLRMQTLAFQIDSIQMICRFHKYIAPCCRKFPYDEYSFPSSCAAVEAEDGTLFLHGTPFREALRRDMESDKKETVQQNDLLWLMSFTQK